MKKRFYLYALLVLFVSAQVVLMKRLTWVPDIILLMVVFTGIFRGALEGASLGLLAGFLRGGFSVDTFGLDIFLFPLIGAASSVLGGMFYRHKPLAQIFITSVAAVTVVTAHTIYLNFLSGNDVGLISAMLKSWKVLAATILLSPFFFAFLKGLLKFEE